jgi:excisionase family DNA binding protein
MPTRLNYTDGQAEKFLTFDQVITLLSLGPDTMRDWMVKRKVPFYKLGFKTIRFRLSDIEALLDRSLIPATGAGPVPVRKPRGKKPQGEVAPAVAQKEEVAATT